MHADLVIAHAVVIATPPIGAPSDEGLSAQPPAIVPIGVVIGTVDPDPDAIPKYPMTMMEAIKVMAALRKSAVFEPVAAVVALYESATITVLETTTSRSAIEVAAAVRSRTTIGAATIVTATATAGEAATTARASA